MELWFPSKCLILQAALAISFVKINKDADLS